MSNDLITKILGIMTEKKSEIINLRVSQTVKEFARSMASQKETNVNEYISQLIIEDYLRNYVKTNGGNIEE